MKKIFQKTIIANILSALSITGIGFILLNIAFLLDALYQGLINRVIGLFVTLDVDMRWSWLPPLKHGGFVVLIVLISWLVLRSKLKTLVKATYLIVPLATIYVTIGIFFYRWPAAVYLLAGLFGASVASYLYRHRLPWQYYFSLIIVTLALLIMMLTGQDI